jgi:hypothetical protein
MTLEVVLGFVLGVGLGALTVRHGRQPTDLTPERPQAGPPARPSPTGGVLEHDRIDDEAEIQTACAVIDVALRLTSPELSRRLGEALRPLVSVQVITPDVGEAFDATSHVWEESRETGEGQAAGTIATVRVPGLRDARSGAVHRKARVVVFQ